MASRKAETGQERGSGVVDGRPTKRARVEDEGASDDEEDQDTPRVVKQASDLYLDTVRPSWFVISTRALIRVFTDKPRQTRL